MPSDQPPALLTRFTLDVVTGIDVVVGWRLNAVSRPGRMPTQDSFLVSDGDDIDALVHREYAALLVSTQYGKELKDAIVAAAVNVFAEIGREFEIDDFTYFLHRFDECTECQGKVQCPRCHKSGIITNVYQAYLVGICVETGKSGWPSLVATPAEVPGSAPPAVAPTRLKRWHWVVPIAALATMVMAIGLGLRLMAPADVARLTTDNPILEAPAPAPAPSTPPPLVEPAPPPVADLPASVAEPAATAATAAAVQPEPPAIAPETLTLAAVAPIQPPPEADDQDTPLPQRKPPISEAAPAKPPVAPPASAAAKAQPAGRLQSALTQLGIYHGPITGELDEQTRRALSGFLARVPTEMRAKYGTAVAAMAEAAARHEFRLKAP